jgi:hypothetical protein
VDNADVELARAVRSRRPAECSVDETHGLPAVPTAGAAVTNRLVEVGVVPRQRLEGDAACADEVENGSLRLRFHGSSIGTS